VYNPETLVCTYTGTYTVIGLTWLKNLYSVAVHKIENNQCIDFKKPDASLYSYNCSVQTNTFSLTILNVTRPNGRENWICAVHTDNQMVVTVQSEPVSIQIISKYQIGIEENVFPFLTCLFLINAVIKVTVIFIVCLTLIFSLLIVLL
jgi:hypothetical protein